MYIYYGSRAEGGGASKQRWKHVTDRVTELLTETNVTPPNSECDV